VLAQSITPHQGSLSEWVINLRPGVTWHDGKDFTASDVLFTFPAGLLERLHGQVSALGPIDLANTKALDPHTVLVRLTKPFSSFAEQLAAFWYNLYIAPAGFNPAKPVGTGAFVYQSFTPGQRSVFTRNPHYWKSGLPYVDTLTIIDFSDNTTLQDALSTGRHPGSRCASTGRRSPPSPTAGGIKTIVSALRRDHPLHDARRPGALQRRQGPPGHAAAGRPAADDRLGSRRLRGGGE